MKETCKLAAGYNWFSVGSFRDITMNENIIHVPTFMKTVKWAEEYFLKSDQSYNCEYKMAAWVKKSLSDVEKEFFRLPDREQEPGIGWEIRDIPYVYGRNGESVPMEVLNRLEGNQRFFNRKWQMIGSHDNKDRLAFWLQIRRSVSYTDFLEKEEHFGRWLEAARRGLPWNIEEKNLSRLTRLLREKPVRTKKFLPLKAFFKSGNGKDDYVNRRSGVWR
jgi:hypothetical protein